MERRVEAGVPAQGRVLERGTKGADRAFRAARSAFEGLPSIRVVSTIYSALITKSGERKIAERPSPVRETSSAGLACLGV
jgi:hypothetical protein